jgi:4-alpha-glucanotransferase
MVNCGATRSSAGTFTAKPDISGGFDGSLESSVLLFGFTNEPAGNVNAIHNIPENCVVFTGTHDNNTVRGWFENEGCSFEKRRLELVLGREPALDEMHWDMIRLAMMSPAQMCIIPVQDLLGLGSEARINSPGRNEDNWLWRMPSVQFATLPQRRLRELTEAFGRLGMELPAAITVCRFNGAIFCMAEIA